MRVQKYLMGLLFSIFFSLAWAQDHPYRKGYEWYFQGKYAEALSLFEKGAGLPPYEYPSLLLAGRCCFQIGKYREALAWYERAQSLRKGDTTLFYHRAQAQHNLGEFEKAIEGFKEVLKVYPNNLFANHWLGMSYQAKNENALALKQYEKAIALYPSFYPAYARAGACLASSKKWTEAKAYLDKAIQLRPSFLDAYYDRSQVLLFLGNPKGCIEDLLFITRENPSHGQSWYLLGRLWKEEKRYQESLEAYEKAEPSLPEEQKKEIPLVKATLLYELGRYPQALSLLDMLGDGKDRALVARYKGMVYRQLKKDDLALQHFDKAITHDPAHWEAYLGRAEIYAEKGPYHLAIKDCSTLIDAGYPGHEPFYYRGNARRQIKEYERALDDYRQCIERKPDYAPAYVGCHEIRKNFARSKIGPEKQALYAVALKDIEKAIALDAGNPNYYNQRGVLYYEQDLYHDAIESFTQAIGIHPKAAEFYYNRGRSKRDLKKLDEAIEDFLTAIRIQPDRADAHYSLGRAYTQIGEDRKALESYGKAIEQKPDYDSAYFHRSVLLQKMGNLKSALKDISKAIEIKPERDIDAFYHRRSQLYLETKEYAKALEDINRTLSVNPNKKRYYLTRAQIYDATGEQEKATNDRKRAEEVME